MLKWLQNLFAVFFHRNDPVLRLANALASDLKLTKSQVLARMAKEGPEKLMQEAQAKRDAESQVRNAKLEELGGQIHDARVMNRFLKSKLDEQ